MGDTEEVYCPYCAQGIEVVIDPSAGSQKYVEGCWVCCRPILFTVRQDPQGKFSGDVRRENE
ncbi:MAG: CPXCG motif-containing cysteine-rich protein [Candidatus Omnitrophica bacterium]|nr:CPXCG motif-containing cysteine-rich protein [Candidatus Omnitrophota bacterium]